MRYRTFKVKSTGDFVDVIHAVDGDEFSVSEYSHRESLSEAMGLRIADLEVVESDSDPRVGAIIKQPVGPPKHEFRWSSATNAQRLEEIRKRLGIPN